MSNNYLNDIIAHSFDFTDEEIMLNYISLLKGLAVNLSHETLQLFIAKVRLTQGSFPLLSQSALFYNHPDAMVRTSSRTVVINVLKSNAYAVRAPAVTQYLLQLNFLPHLVCYMRDQWIAIDQQLLEIDPSHLHKLDDMLNEQVDSLLYLNDIFQIDIPEVNFSLGDLFLRMLALPLIAGSLGAERRLREHLGIPAATYFLVQAFTHLKHSPVVNTLLVAMFMPKVTPALYQAIQKSAPPAPASYTLECSILSRPSADPPVMRKKKDRRQESLMVEYIDTEEEPDLRPNSVREIFLSYLRSKDNNLILLTLLVLQAAMGSSAINQTLLAATGLMPLCQSRKQKLLNSILEEQYEEAKEAEKPHYDHVLIESLLKLFDTEPLFRTATYRLAVKLVILLVHNENSAQCLIPEHEYLLDRAFKYVLNKLKRMLLSPTLSDLFMEFFEEEWRKTSKFTLTERTSCPAILLVPADDEAMVNLPLHMRLPVGDIETARCLLAVFFNLRLLKLYMSREESQAKAFPLGYLRAHCDWEEGQEYAIGKALDSWAEPRELYSKRREDRITSASCRGRESFHPNGKRPRRPQQRAGEADLSSAQRRGYV